MDFLVGKVELRVEQWHKFQLINMQFEISYNLEQSW